jgi:hypothetical protein
MTLIEVQITLFITQWLNNDLTMIHQNNSSIHVVP